MILIWITNTFLTHKKMLYFIFYVLLKINLNCWLSLAILLVCILTFVPTFQAKFGIEKHFVFSEEPRICESRVLEAEEEEKPTSGKPATGNLRCVHSEDLRHSKCITHGDIWKREWRTHLGGRAGQGWGIQKGIERICMGVVGSV